MILILGSGRSGTTFLAKLFDSHPDVLYRHEPDSVLLDPSIPYHPSSDDVENFRDRANRYLQRLVAERAPKVSVHVPLFPKRYRSRLGQRIYETISLAAKSAAKVPGIEGLIQVPDLVGRGTHAPIVVIKSVNSLNRARLYLEADPELRIVHIVRHPCGVVASQLRGAEERLMNPQVFFDALYRLPGVERYGLPRAEMEQRSFEEQAAFQWMVTNDQVCNEASNNPRYRMVRYEDLCLNSQDVIDDLFAFCGLEKNAQTDAFIDHLEGRQSGSAAYFSVMRSPKKAVFKWKDELSSQQVDLIEAVAQRSEIGSPNP